MAKYHFYYDESEHSRKINLNEVNAKNYYDNFIAVIVGWTDDSERVLFEKYAAFEEEYSARKSKGELKSQTLKQNQFENTGELVETLKAFFKIRFNVITQTYH